MLIHDFRCFGVRAGEGNSALVVEGDHAGAEARQAYANAQGRSATVYIDHAADGSAAVTLDYFYPHMRSPLCLHATLAAAAVLFAQRGTGAPITVTTAMHGQPLVLSRADGLIFVRLTRQAAPQPLLDDALVRRLLGVDGVPGAARVASVGSPKLLIEVADRATLHALAPDLDAILAWGRAHGVSGCYAWCRLAGAEYQGDSGRPSRGEHDGEPDGDSAREYEGRNFNHLPGATEDAATGVAAGALTVLLGHGLRLLQGSTVGQTCLLHTRIDGDAILVGGHAQ